MVRLRWLRWGLTTLALFGVRPASADPINFTGFVENDFDATNQRVRVTKVTDNPLSIGQAPFMTNNGWVSGWSIKDIRTSYDPSTDTLSVGVNTFKNSQGLPGIVGDADGNGDPGGADPQTTKSGGIDLPHLGGRKSVAVAFAPGSVADPAVPGKPLIIAGVPADKSAAGPGTDGFTVAQHKGLDIGLGYNFGQALTNHLGALAFDPSAQHPGFEFTIKNFSKIPGLDPTKDLWITAYAGSPDDVVAGETALQLTRVPALAEQNIPEPATVLTWSLVAGAAAVRWRRRSSGVRRS